MEASRVLLIGCGSQRDRIIRVGERVRGPEQWLDQEVVTLDSNPSHNPDVVWDLNYYPWIGPDRQAIPDNSFDEVHAYEVLEHLGRLGDSSAFFRTFYEIWRILKPNGYLCGTVPHWASMWAFGDPSHTRIINEGSLTFLDQEQYHLQIGKTPMSDFRDVWKGDFDVEWCANVGSTLDSPNPTNFWFRIRAVKPARTF